MPLKLRPAIPTDATLLERWDREPHVIAATSDDPEAAQAFGDMDWAAELGHGDPASAYFIAEVDGRPIGCMQVVDPARERTQYWGADIPPNLRAMDIWIGEKEYLGRGYGTQMMSLAIDAAFAEDSVEAILIDPLASNERAHRFYRRLGFQFLERRSFDGDDCFVFRLDRRVWKRRQTQRDPRG